MQHADTSRPVRAQGEAHGHDHTDDQSPELKDAARMLWIVVGAIAAWSAAIYFFVL